MCTTNAKGKKADCGRCSCPQSTAHHTYVTQEVTIGGKPAIVKMCSKCGSRA